LNLLSCREANVSDCPCHGIKPYCEYCVDHFKRQAGQAKELRQEVERLKADAAAKDKALDEAERALKRVADRGAPCLCCDQGYDDFPCSCYDEMAKAKEAVASIPDVLSSIAEIRGKG
jgi:hypothetical protein